MGELLVKLPRQQALMYAGFLVLYEFLTYIANDMIMPGMLKVVETFHAAESVVASSLTLYVLGGASLQIFLGPLSDYFGRRPVMIAGAIFFALLTILIAGSNSTETFLWGRFFEGMGLCFINVVGYATLQEIFVEMEAIRLTAMMANVAIVAPLIGPLFGAVFMYYYSWRIIFVLIGFFAAIASWGLWRFMPEPVEKAANPAHQHALKTVFRNYRTLWSSPVFILSAVALGLIYLPCMAWIALSPIMLVKESHLTLIQYGLWQVPVFGAYILGNIFLANLTHHQSMKSIIQIGTYIIVVSLLLMGMFSYIFNDNFYWLMPGLIIYFFGLSTAAGPLIRFILFSTPVTKGTAAALMSMISMLIQALGVELANLFYTSHNNLIFGFYCTFSGLMYAFFVMLALKFAPKTEL